MASLSANLGRVLEKEALKSIWTRRRTSHSPAFQRTQILSHQLLDGRYDRNLNMGDRPVMSQLNNTACELRDLYCGPKLT